MNPEFETLAAQLPTWARPVIVPLIAIGVGLVVQLVVFAAGRRLARATRWDADDLLFRRLRRPSSLLFPLVALQIAEPALRIPDEAHVLIARLLSLAVIGTVSWVLVKLVGAIQDAALARFELKAADNLEARQLHTQIRVFGRTAKTFVGVVGAAIALMTIPAVRELGAGLLASAGAAGLVVGLAARPAVSNLIAGLQLAITQPIRIDDVVIVEGQWGWIEEISSTYVVVRIWDERRLVVPLSYFIERPFENWTRKSSEILGTVSIHADYTVPVDEVRKELERLVKDSSDWDGRVVALQVTGASDRSVELRALISAEDSGKAWNLRCHLREQLLAFLQKHHPRCLPRVRAQVSGAGTADV